MNREIKFRAWDKILKRTREVSCVNFFDELVILDETNYGHVTQKISDVELMQFTGLLDKNGKEIYEEDIVEWHPDYDLKEGGKAVIVWDKDQWCPSSEKTGASGYYGYDGREFQWEDLEIIGNIYENPDLIK